MSLACTPENLLEYLAVETLSLFVVLLTLEFTGTSCHLNFDLL